MPLLLHDTGDFAAAVGSEAAGTDLPIRIEDFGGGCCCCHAVAADQDMLQRSGQQVRGLELLVQARYGPMSRVEGFCMYGTYSKYASTVYAVYGAMPAP